MTRATKFFEEYDFILPGDFIHPALYPATSEDNLLWGPFMALLVNSNAGFEEKVNAWLRRSDERVQYIERTLSKSKFEIEWWTDRQHIFEVTDKPKIEYGILKLRNRREKNQLWLRNLNFKENIP